MSVLAPTRTVESDVDQLTRHDVDLEAALEIQPECQIFENHEGCDNPAEFVVTVVCVCGNVQSYTSCGWHVRNVDIGRPRPPRRRLKWPCKVCQRLFVFIRRTVRPL